MKGANRHPLRVSSRGIGFELTNQLLPIAHQPSFAADGLRLVMGGAVLAWHAKDYGPGVVSESTGMKFWYARLRQRPRRDLQR